MEELVKIIVDNGVSVGCLVYFMWYNNVTGKQMKDSLDKLTQIMIALKESINGEKKS